MLRSVFTAVIGMVAIAANAQDNFTIKGKLGGANEGKKVMVDYIYQGKMSRDSAIIHNGNFEVKGKIGDPVKARISVQNAVLSSADIEAMQMGRGDDQEFFLENVPYNVKGTVMRSATITGGTAQADFAKLQAMLQPMRDEMKPLSEKMMVLYREKKEEEMKAMYPRFAEIREKMAKVEEAFILANGDSNVSLDLISDRAVVINEAVLDPFYNALSARLKTTANGKSIGERLNTARKFGIGKPALEFVQNDQNGKALALSSLKGKYVLVDFWASWCGPCRHENPNVVVAYNKFKDKNFEILGVSLDSNKDAWLKAIATDGLPWLQVSDLKGWDNQVAALYDVRAVPQNFLISPDGKIIAKNLQGAELQQKLAEVVR